jgi:stress response protein YsnF
MSGIEEGPKHRADLSAGEETPSGRSIDEATVVRFEERLVPTTQRVPVQRARLQRFVVTERRTITVDVRHEEVRVVFDDIAPGEPAVVDPSVDATPPVLLREERLEVVRTVVPVERVRLVKERTTTEQIVSGSVRREEFDLDGV